MRWMTAGIAVFAVSEAHALELPTPVKPFVTRCIETDVTGFSWKDGAWVRAAFAPTTLVIQKFNSAKHGGAENECDADDEDRVEEDEVAGFAWLNGCYSVAPEKEEPVFHWCTEYYDYLRDKWVLNSVRCHAVFNDHPVAFRPDGRFVYSRTEAILSDKPGDPEKDNLRLSHGSCTTVK